MKQSLTTPALTKAFFAKSAGKWRSLRRYYTLNSNHNPLEATTDIDVTYLESGHPDLLKLATLHNLPANQAFDCGAIISWKSQYTNVERKPLEGSTIFGILGNRMYRDRGFSTAKPIVATFQLINENLLRLQTSYNGSHFEEEIKLIGDRHRTRQTITSCAGHEVMVAQYLETRCD